MVRADRVPLASEEEMKPQEIKRIRLRKEMTQEEFAQAVGSSRRAVVRWEKGESVPHKMFVEKIKELARGG